MNSDYSNLNTNQNSKNNYVEFHTKTCNNYSIRKSFENDKNTSGRKFDKSLIKSSNVNYYCPEHDHGHGGFLHEFNYFEYLLNEDSDLKKLFLCEENEQFFVCLLGEFNITILEISNKESSLDLYMKIKNLYKESVFQEDVRFSMEEADVEANNNRYEERSDIYSDNSGNYFFFLFFEEILEKNIFFLIYLQNSLKIFFFSFYL